MNKVSEIAVKDLITLNEEERCDKLVNYLRARVSEVLECSVESVPAEENFLELGLDSLMMMNLSDTLQKDIGVNLSMRTLFDCPTIRDMAVYISHQLGSNPDMVNEYQEEDFEEGSV